MANGGSDVQLLISLGIDDHSSRNNIKQYISKLKTENLDVTLNVTGNSSNDKVFKSMEKEMEDLRKQANDLSKLLDSIRNGKGGKGGKSFRIVDDLKAEQDAIRKHLSKSYKDFDFKINVDNIEGQKVLKGFTATVRDVNDEVKKLSFNANFEQLSSSLKDTNLKNYKESLEAVNKSLDSAKNKALLSSNEIEKFQNKLKAIKMNNLEPDKAGAFTRLKSDIEQTISSTKQFDKVTNNINEALISMGRNGSISGEKLGEVVSKVSRINAQDITLDEKVVKLRQELDRLNNEFDETQHINKMNTAMESAKRSVKDLESNFLKLINQNKRVASTMDLSGYRRQLQELSNIPIFRNQKDIDKFNAKLKTSQSEVRRLGSDMTQANRESRTLFQNFKTAMEKFPIWIDMLVQNKLF